MPPLSIRQPILGERFCIYACKAEARMPICSEDLRVATPRRAASATPSGCTAPELWRKLGGLATLAYTARSQRTTMPIPRYKIFSPEDAARVSKLQLTARQVVEGVITGLHKSPHRGFSVEFSEHREYVAGR